MINYFHNKASMFCFIINICFCALFSFAIVSLSLSHTSYSTQHNIIVTLRLKQCIHVQHYYWILVINYCISTNRDRSQAWNHGLAQSYTDRYKLITDRPTHIHIDTVIGNIRLALNLIWLFRDRIAIS